MTDAKRIVESETWGAQQPYSEEFYGYGVPVIYGPASGAHRFYVVNADEGGDEEAQRMPARARIASVAPEALRLLLEFRSSATSYQASEIDAVLRKAGVLE